MPLSLAHLLVTAAVDDVLTQPQLQPCVACTALSKHPADGNYSRGHCCSRFMGVSCTAMSYRVGNHCQHNLHKAILSHCHACICVLLSCRVSNHRQHHLHTDTPLDPHSPYEGFWWSHMGWLVADPQVCRQRECVHTHACSLRFALQ